MGWNPDLSQHIMECSATAALQDKIMNGRDATVEELAGYDEAKLERARKLMIKSGFAFEAMAETLPDSYFMAFGLVALNNPDYDSAFCESVGKKIIQSVRDYALKCAGEV